MPMRLKGILTFAAVAGFAGAASAADIYQPPPPISSPIYSPAPVFSWTGFYLGVQGGYDWNHATSPAMAPAPASAANENGGIAGIYAGYNWQTASNWVFGIDGSINYSWARGSDPTSPVTHSAGPTWKGLLRGKIGYAWDRFMVYGTAGGAMAGYEAVVTGVGTGTATPAGWTVGAGVEMAVTDNVIARLDYSYQDYGTFNLSCSGCGTFPTGVSGTPVTLKSHTLMAGIGVKF